MTQGLRPLPGQPPKPAEAGDPLDAVAIRVPVDDPDRGILDAARCFVEEFITMGYTDTMILHMFRNPFYMGLHPLYERRGEDFARALTSDCRRELAATGRYPRRSKGVA